MFLRTFLHRDLFTNAPVQGALEAIEKVVASMDEDLLPLPKKVYVKLVALCMKFGCFPFNGEEYLQKSGLAMGSPRSPVAACLYMETFKCLILLTLSEQILSG